MLRGDPRFGPWMERRFVLKQGENEAGRMAMYRFGRGHLTVVDQAVTVFERELGCGPWLLRPSLYPPPPWEFLLSSACAIVSERCTRSFHASNASGPLLSNPTIRNIQCQLLHHVANFRRELTSCGDCN